MKLIKSTSMRSMFKTCPRLIYFRYVAAIQRREKLGARTTGKAFHEGLELLRNNKDIIEVSEHIKDRFSKASNGAIEPEIERIKTTAYLIGYRARFNRDWDYQILTEHQIEIDDEICYIDAAIVNDDESIDIIEDKTAASLADDQEFAIVMNDQLLNYVDLCEQSEYQVRNIFYRETQKSLHSQTKKESLNEFRLRIEDMYIINRERYREFTFEKNRRDLVRFRFDKKRINNHIDDMVYDNLFRPFDIWPCNGMACIGRFGACDYLPICSRSKIWVPDLYEPNGKEPIDEGDFIKEFAITDGSLNINQHFEEVTND